MSSISMPLLPGADPDDTTGSLAHKKCCCASSCIASEPALADSEATTTSSSSEPADSPQNGKQSHSSQNHLTAAGSNSSTVQERCHFAGNDIRSVRRGCSDVALDSLKPEHKPALARSCGILSSFHTKNSAEADAAEAIVPLMCEDEETARQKDCSGEKLVEWPEAPAQGPYSRLNESSGLMCRICHSGNEEEELITPCRCMGTVRHAHQSCILNWISKSGHPDCELCKYKFKTTRKKIKSCWKWSFPHISTKGWLHIGLFIAFSTMLLTSVTWIVWSRASDAPTALAERTTEEVKFAYMLNGLFIALAIGGLYFDSYKHFKRYSKRWAVMNQHMVVECYFAEAKLSAEAGVATEVSELNRRRCSDSEPNDPGTWV